MKHILVIDEDRTSLEIINSTLGSTYRVTELVTGPQVLQFLTTTVPDLILMEVKLEFSFLAITIEKVYHKIRIHCCCSVAKLHLTLCNPCIAAGQASLSLTTPLRVCSNSCPLS